MTQVAAILPQLQEICSNLQIHDANSYTFGEGERQEVASGPRMTDKGLDQPASNPVDRYAPLIASLCKVLYSQCYRGNYPLEPGQVADPAPDISVSKDLTPLFLQANHSKDGWDGGWQVYQIGMNGRLFVQKGERSRAVMAGEYTTYKWPGVAPRNGDWVSVRMFTGSIDVQPGYFFAFGRTLSDQFDDFTLVRFYFNIKAEAVVSLMSMVTATLNRYFIPFKFKALVKAGAYTCADAAVLYVGKRYYHVVASLMSELGTTLSEGLRDGTPMFSKMLVPGIGMAEDPNNGESFGMHRCNLLAQAMVEAWAAGSQEVVLRLAAIQRCFGAVGIELATPYLNPNSVNIFDQPIFSKETQW